MLGCRISLSTDLKLRMPPQKAEFVHVYLNHADLMTPYTLFGRQFFTISNVEGTEQNRSLLGKVIVKKTSL